MRIRADLSASEAIEWALEVRCAAGPTARFVDAAGRLRRGLCPPWWTERTKRVVHLVLRDGPGCFYCGLMLDEERGPQVDHYVPRSAGGPDRLSNLRLACGPCNAEKGARLP